MNKQLIRRPTNVGMAFYNMAQNVHNHCAVTRRVLDNVAQHERAFMVAEPAVNAHLSFRTAKQLKADGVLA